MVHCYPLLAPAFREATEAMDEIVGFIRKHLQINGNNSKHTKELI
jgi:hypothetical protein